MEATLAGMALVFAVAVLTAYLLTPLAERACWRFGLVDRPRPGELQLRPAARAGGYAIVLAFLAALAVSLVLHPRTAVEEARLTGFLVGVALVIPLALVDDFRRLGPAPQALGHVAAAAAPIAFGLIIDNVASPFGGLIYLPLLVALPFTLLWVVGMVNTLNMIDSMDGLATGVAAIAALVLFVRSFSLGQHSIAVLPLALAGACLGFLPYNFSPARIFAGTGGSFFLGYSLAVLAIIGGAKIATAMMVLGLPIIDVAVVIVRRLLAGRSPFQGGDGAHLVHRLSASGLPTRRIAVLIYVFCALTGWLALALTSLQKLYLFGAAGLLFLAVVAALAYRTRRPALR